MIKLFQTTEEWLSFKEGRIGGTAISSVLKLNQYESPLQLYYKMKGQEPEVEVNDSMRQGIFLEEGVLNFFMDDYPTSKLLYDKKDGIPVFVHPKNDKLISSPDGIVEMNGFNGQGVYVDEVKTTRKVIQDMNDIGSNWICQLNWNLGLAILNGLDIKGGYFSVLSYPVGEIISLPYEFNKDFFDIQVKGGEYFLEMLKNNVEPDPTSLEDFNYIKADPKSIIYANEKIIKTLQDYKRYKEEEEAAKKRKEDCGFFVKSYMNKYESLRLSDDTKLASFSNVNRVTFDVIKFREENPEVYAKYTVTRFARRLVPNYHNI